MPFEATLTWHICICIYHLLHLLTSSTLGVTIIESVFSSEQAAICSFAKCVDVDLSFSI